MKTEHSIIPGIISFVVISAFTLFLLLDAIHLTYNLFLPNQGRFSLEQEKEELMNKNPSPGHVLISSRSLVNGYGRRTLGQKKDHWSGIESQENVLAELTSNTPFVVVFVHGYNTPSERAFELGERLWNLVCKEDSLMYPNVKLYSFLWRGDLNPAEFRSAQRAAKTSARSFAAFVRRLHESNPELPIVVVSHSLGARVVLEGLRFLRESEERLWVKTVILIQPAVNVASVSKWKQGYIFKTWKEGAYWEALKSAGYVIATVSDGDKILSKYFSFGQKPTNKPFSSALGSVTNLTDWTGYYRATSQGPTLVFKKRESPVVPFDITPLGHSEIFEPDSIPEEKLALLWSLALEHVEISHNN